MKRELIDAAPIRSVLAEVEELAAVAHELTTEALSERVRQVARGFEAALADAERPDFTKGYSPEEYARERGLKLGTVYKRIQRSQISVERDGRLIRIVA